MAFSSLWFFYLYIKMNLHKPLISVRERFMFPFRAFFSAGRQIQRFVLTEIWGLICFAVKRERNLGTCQQVRSSFILTSNLCTHYSAQCWIESSCAAAEMDDQLDYQNISNGKFAHTHKWIHPSLKVIILTCCYCVAAAHTGCAEHTYV